MAILWSSYAKTLVLPKTLIKSPLHLDTFQLITLPQPLQKINRLIQQREPFSLSCNSFGSFFEVPTITARKSGGSQYSLQNIISVEPWAEKQVLSDGTHTRSQLITGRPYRVPTSPIPYGALVTAPRIGKTRTVSPSNNEVFLYLMPAKEGTQAHIVVSLYSKRAPVMYIRKDVRLLNIMSQLQLSETILNAKLQLNASGEYDISGMIGLHIRRVY